MASIMRAFGFVATLISGVYGWKSCSPPRSHACFVAHVPKTWQALGILRFGLLEGFAGCGQTKGTCNSRCCKSRALRRRYPRNCRRFSPSSDVGVRQMRNSRGFSTSEFAKCETVVAVSTWVHKRETAVAFGSGFGRGVRQMRNRFWSFWTSEIQGSTKRGGCRQLQWHQRRSFVTHEALRVPTRSLTGVYAGITLNHILRILYNSIIY